MKKYLIDTNIIIHLVRESFTWEYVSKNYFPKGIKNYGCISLVSIAEVKAFAYENGWGKAKRKELRQALKQFEIFPVTKSALIDDYVQVSAYSRSRHKSLRLPRQFSARDMGKNDIWIAATAMSRQMPLITTDRDFEHLDGVFLDLILIDAAQFSPPSHV